MNNDFISGVGIGAILCFAITIATELRIFKIKAKDFFKK